MWTILKNSNFWSLLLKKGPLLVPFLLKIFTICGSTWNCWTVWRVKIGHYQTLKISLKYHDIFWILQYRDISKWCNILHSRYIAIQNAHPWSEGPLVTTFQSMRKQHCSLFKGGQWGSQIYRPHRNLFNTDMGRGISNNSETEFQRLVLNSLIRSFKSSPVNFVSALSS